MRVRVSLMRKAGHWLTWNEKPRQYTGALLSKNAGKDEIGIMSCVFIPEGPSLYDPRIKSVFGTEMRLVGLEKVDGAWVLQEWSCEVSGT